MNRKTRRIVFYIFLLLFIAVGTAVVSYSQGWQFNFKTDQFEKTGGIYLKTEPSDATITLDGRLVKNRSSLFQTGTLISNLTKGKYCLNVFKDGYYSWEKSAEVEPGMAAVFDKIVLLPQNNAKKTGEPTDNFAVLEGKTVEVKNGVITFGDRLVRGNKIIDVSPGGKVITASMNGIYYLTDLSAGNGTSLNINTLFTNLKQSELNLPGIVSITAIDFHSFDDNRVAIETAGGLYILDTKNLSLKQVASNPIGFTVSGDQLVWTSADGVWSYNLVLRTATKISNKQTSLSDPAVGIGVSSSGSLVTVLQKKGTLTLIDYASQKSLTVADKVKEFAFSPDSRYLAYADYDGPLAVYRIDQPAYLELNPAKGAPISALRWYKDSAHLIALREGNLDFIEVDAASPINSALIAGQTSKFSYDRSDDLIYYLTPEGLFSFSLTR